LLDFEPEQWPHRIFTTGATSANILGLACGREYVIAEASAHRTDAEISVGELGIVEAMRSAGIDDIQILTTVPHSSLGKAAGILGLGRTSVKCLGQSEAPHKFDMQLLKKSLEQPGAASIVAVSASEVNTGVFATSGLEEMEEIRKLCDSKLYPCTNYT
jgi:glutamate/tyrosine decarboxylase-like PLP-dependent enzyme